MEDYFFFTTQRYDPEWIVKTVSKENARYDSPENCAIAAISAMSEGDYEWYLSLWTKDSQLLMERNDREQNHPPAFWRSVWAKHLTGSVAVLVERIVTEQFVLVSYKIKKKQSQPASKEGELELVLVLREQDGLWRATQELAQDPVLLYWKTPGQRVKRELRGVGQGKGQVPTRAQ